MNAISVCDGISAASVACEGLDFNFLLLSEIEPFPRSVLQQRHRAVDQRTYTAKDSVDGKPILWGDFTTIRSRHIRRAHGHANVDVLFGGTPCQSYSVAGKRSGLDDPRGELSLEYALLAYRLGVRWFLWENVPGVFSSSEGRDFAAILSAFTGRVVEVPRDGWQNSGIIPEAGPGHFGIAWRVFDAQYAGVPQRRRRVFVVGHLGDWRRAASVLFDSYSLQGHPAPRRETGKDIAPTISARPSGGGGLGTDFDLDGGLIAGTLQAGSKAAGSATQQDAESGMLIAQPLRSEGYDASEDGTGRGTPRVPIAFAQNSRDEVRVFGEDGQTVGALAAEPGMKQQCYVAFQSKASASQSMNLSVVTPAMDVGKSDGLAVAIGWSEELTAHEECAGTVQRGGQGGRHEGVMTPQMAVRRLIPEECELLQGYKRGYTAVMHRGKPAADGPRYKALGNSWAVPCVRWIAERMLLANRNYALEQQGL